MCKVIHVDEFLEGVCSDPDDEKFISCALSSGAEFLVSGDNHLLEIKKYKSIRIIAAKEFVDEYRTDN